MDPPDCTIHFRSDGLSLSPAEYSRLLARLTDDEGIAADEFSLGGAVEQLEQRMAELLGKELAVFNAERDPGQPSRAPSLGAARTSGAGPA